MLILPDGSFENEVVHAPFDVAGGEIDFLSSDVKSRQIVAFGSLNFEGGGESTDVGCNVLHGALGRLTEL